MPGMLPKDKVCKFYVVQWSKKKIFLKWWNREFEVFYINIYLIFFLLRFFLLKQVPKNCHCACEYKFSRLTIEVTGFNATIWTSNIVIEEWVIYSCKLLIHPCFSTALLTELGICWLYPLQRINMPTPTKIRGVLVMTLYLMVRFN